MKLIPFLSQSKSLDSNLNNSWPFPSCGNTKTLSFRDTSNNNFYKDDNFTTFNSAFLDTPHSFFSISSSSRSFSIMSDDINPVNDPIDSVINGLRSDRLFFEPEHSCSLVQQQELLQQRGRQEEQEQEEEEEEEWVEESEAVCMESKNPCKDFRRSMEEMVEAHGLKDWEGLEELLGCYLKINAKTNHGYIMAAFIDLLVNLTFISSSTTTTTTNSTTKNTSNNSNTTTLSSLLSINDCSTTSPSSPLSLPSSSFTTQSLSSLFDHSNHEEEEEEEDDDR